MQRIYVYNEKSYVGTIVFRRGKTMTLRVDAKNETLRVGAPTHLSRSLKTIDRFVMDNLPKLIQRESSKKPDYADGKLYVFGEEKDVGELNETEIDAYLKKIGLPYLEERTRYYESLMGIKDPYRVRIRTMKTRYGVNSPTTHTVTFTTRLICYSPEVIDSVVVHELAHHFVHNHQKKFYDIVYRYCPDYRLYHAKLRKTIHD